MPSPRATATSTDVSSEHAREPDDVRCYRMLRELRHLHGLELARAVEDGIRIGYARAVEELGRRPVSTPPAATPVLPPEAPAKPPRRTSAEVDALVAEARALLRADPDRPLRSVATALGLPAKYLSNLLVMRPEPRPCR